MPVRDSNKTDRVEAFIRDIDSYEPASLPGHADVFRIFAHSISRTLDNRYLERHPSVELLPDIEYLMLHSLKRQPQDILVHLAIHGEAQSRRAVLVTCMPDRRFIYSIVKMGLEKLGVRTYRFFNSVIPVERDSSGRILHVTRPESPVESFIWVEVEAAHVADRIAQIEGYLRARLRTVQGVVDDYPNIAKLVTKQSERFFELARHNPDLRPAYEDSARLLQWLAQDNFVFFGTRFLPSDAAAADNPAASAYLQENWGVGRLSDDQGLLVEQSDSGMVSTGPLPPFLWIRKSGNEAWMYRPGKTDHILIQCLDERGGQIGLLVIEGMFSFPALAQPRTQVPLLDRIIDSLYIQLKASRGSHRYRTIRNAYNSLPLEYLFALAPEDIKTLVEQILEVDAEQRPQVHITCDSGQSIAFVFVALPRTHFSDEVRAEIRRLLHEAFGASSIDDGMYAGNFDSIALHYFLTGIKPLTPEAEASLQSTIEQIASPWTERLEDSLEKTLGRVQGRALHNLYHEAFPRRYREETPIARAVSDISILEQLGTHHTFDCDIYTESHEEKLGIYRLRMYQTNPLLLSEILPILNHFGLIVIDQFPTAVQVPSRPEFRIATFRLSGAESLSVDLASRRNRLCDAIRAVVLGAMTNDPLNRLLLRADIPWPSVVLVQAYQIYARQIGMPVALATVQEALLTHPGVVRAVSELFRAKFEPDPQGDAAADPVHASAAFEQRLQRIERNRRAAALLLESVEDLTHDQVLRTLLNLVEATTRTNFYHRDPYKDKHLVLKFDPSLIERMPEPRPFREIYVHHPEVLGLHLRGGAVARGGIRWSDRLLDFRTEVLGLMATQNLKNALIVPKGAKGVFVLRQPHPDLAQRRIQADAMYEIFIQGLLDVTDNLKNNALLPPKGLVCHDGSDHYLVVAADKGTAHLSDTANRIAKARGFWLADAFASGGSQGYDHKKEAITSRGAWACVRAHFAEMGRDPEVDVVRTVGIGDMSGDVFGNGLLRSKTVKLIGAFDHRHIFIDPNPDPAASYEARLALFAKPRSAWTDYPREHLSPGGGIFPRSAKRITLSPEAQAALGCSTEACSGPELIQLILKAPVDLLWNGGIGTYIKASNESHSDVGDPANDSVRIDAEEVRCKVIGEGGNLGITSAGRIALAASGVALNTDAVDNSAGVDLSDHEVNLKILFTHAATAKSLQAGERDELLEALREQVSEMVVENNRLQFRLISLDVVRSRRDVGRFARAAAHLAKAVPFKLRERDFPGERTLRQREARGDGLYRPELAFLMANAKLHLRSELVSNPEAFSSEELGFYLTHYFPAALRPRFKQAIVEHPLATDIARTVLTNHIFADVGATFLPEAILLTGKDTLTILKAYLQASALLKAPLLKATMQSATITDRSIEYRLRLRLEDALEEVTLWLLRHPIRQLEAFGQFFAAAVDAWHAHSTLPQEDAALLQSASLPQSFNHAIAPLTQVDEILDIALCAEHGHFSIDRVIETFFDVGRQTGLLELMRLVLRNCGSAELERPARFAMREQLRLGLTLLTINGLREEGSAKHQMLIESIKKDIASFGFDVSFPHLLLVNERLRRHLQNLPKGISPS